MNYTKKQKLVIDTIINLTKKIHPKEPELLDGVSSLTENFRPGINKFESTCDGMLGFIQWAKDNNQEEGAILSTLIHDLSEFENNRDADWFSPRTFRYAEFIKELRATTIYTFETKAHTYYIDFTEGEPFPYVICEDEITRGCKKTLGDALSTIFLKIGNSSWKLDKQF